MSEFQKINLTLHVTTAALTLGILFLQSLAVVMSRRLDGESQIAALRSIQERIQAFVYYPMLVVMIITGTFNIHATNAFAQGKWLHWKLLFVLLLLGLGYLIGREIKVGPYKKPFGILIHIMVFVLGYSILWLAVLRPY